MVLVWDPSVGAWYEDLIPWVAHNALSCSGLLRAPCRQKGARRVWYVAGSQVGIGHRKGAGALMWVWAGSGNFKRVLYICRLYYAYCI